MADNSKDEGYVSGLMAFGIILTAIFAYLYALDGSEYDWPAWRSFGLVLIVGIVFFLIMEFALYLAAGILLVGFLWIFFTDDARRADLALTAKRTGVELCANASRDLREYQLYGWICRYN